MKRTRRWFFNKMSTESPRAHEPPRSPHDADDIYYDAEQVSGNDSNDEADKNGDDASVAHRRIKSGPGRQEDTIQSSSEDLFLNLAQDTTPHQSREQETNLGDKRQVPPFI